MNSLENKLKFNICGENHERTINKCTNQYIIRTIIFSKLMLVRNILTILRPKFTTALIQ